ncbi:MAG: hypothetical protein PHY93_04830 [Bacteriovorax sp.]|nr:hypothetical protein [Bacteriovorax sp.]
MKVLTQLLVIILIIAISPKLHATTGLDDAILAEYLKIQKEYSDESCKAGTESAFQELDKTYRGDGNFIPVSLDEKVDLKTIKNLIPLMIEKSLWIQSQIDFIKKIQDSKSLKFEMDRLENDVSLLLEAKKDYFFTKDKAKRDNIQANAGLQFQQMLKEIEQFKNQIPFLLSFKFPVNHLSLRTEYEKFKNQNNKEARLRANSIYLFRKIVQDGTYDENLIKSDAVIRSAFDTLYMSLNKESNRNFLTDNERVDFSYVIRNFDKLLSLKPDALIARYTEWKARNERTLGFYQDLVEGKKIKLSEDSRIKDVTSLLEERARSLYTLKDFVLSRESNTYDFWSRRSELMQSLFAIETILYSEVGRMDAPDALERRDVAQIVINRSENSTYNLLKSQDTITKFLSPKIKIEENKWLNVLFKEGEFSFTYFYIPGNFHIYCPDMSRTGQFLRRENIRIALELLNKPRTNFTALRYFSRTGMFGRIEMDSLWNEFKALPEVPGKPVRNPRKIYGLFKRDQYKFLYDFTNEDLKKSFLVVELKGKTYVVDAKNTKQIYYYRNPQQFKYFTLLK